jgi:hypothetical protein
MGVKIISFLPTDRVDKIEVKLLKKKIFLFVFNSSSLEQEKKIEKSSTPVQTRE